MARKNGKRENYRVVVTPGCASWISLSGRSDAEITCDSIADSIKRHVDDVASVEVEYDQTHVCEHCGNVWTETSDVYNGGCCDADEASNPSASAAA
jgi:protein-arginine kinase activator protein McsA